MNGPRSHLGLQSSHRCIHPARLVTLVLFSSTLVASGMAQTDSFVLIPAILVPAMFCVGFMICGIMCSCICCKFVKVKRDNAARATMVHNATRPTQQLQVIYHQQTPSAFSLQLYPVQSNYPQSVPSEPARTEPQQGIYLQTTPSAGGSQPYPNYPQLVPSQPAYPVPQQISLPEATLHQGDAPPGYEEAVGFTTVNIDGQQTGTSKAEISS